MQLVEFGTNIAPITTSCNALAQLERRMTSQMALTKEDSDCVEAMDLGCLLAFYRSHAHASIFIHKELL